MPMATRRKRRCRAPLGLLAELTHRCPLGCPYCSNPLELDGRDRRARHRDLGAGVQRGGGARRAAGPSLRRRAGRAARPRRDHAGARMTPGLYTNLITSAVGITAKTLGELSRRRARPRADLDPGQRARHRRPHRRLQGRLSRASMRSPPRSTRSACRSPSTPSCTAPTSTTSPRWSSSRSTLGAKRVEIAHAQYYGWALKNRAALMPTPRAGRARREDRSRTLRKRHHGRIVIDAVVPDYYARYPEGLRRRLGAALAQRHALRQGAAVPCGRDHSGSRLLERARAFARRDLGQLAGLQRLSRHRLDAGAVPLTARSASRTSAAAAARPSRSPAMRARPIRSATSRRIMRGSASSALERADAEYDYRR